MKPLGDIAEISLAMCEIYLDSEEGAMEQFEQTTKRRSSSVTTLAFPSKGKKFQGFQDSRCPAIDFGRVLGSGGFGQVYEARCNGRKVAVKQLTLKSKLRNANAPEESLRAESLLLEYSHRNLVEILAVLNGDSIEQCLVIMEFAGERNLQTIIDDECTSLAEERRIRIALDIASGLEFMHEQGLAHLDIKPANVIVNSEFDCKICDFGCCQYVELEDTKDFQPPSPTNSSLAGTYTYRAPELLKGEFPTTKADIFSLGVCLWQLCVREQPYGMESHFVIIFGVVQKNLRPQFPAEIVQDSQNTMYVKLTSSLWHADVSQRPAARQIVKTLKNWPVTLLTR
jgi:proto-oncogene serine/threonine-protein kinase mos